MTYAPLVSSRPFFQRFGTVREDGELPDYTPAIYGSLLTTTIVAVQWRHDAATDLIALSVVISVVVFWLTHVWAEIVNHRVHHDVTRAEIAELASDEAPMLLAVLLPAAILACGRLVGSSVDTAVSLALIVSIGQLFVWGLIVGHAARRGWRFAFGVAAVDCLLGVLIVALKVIVIH
jgi:hypothetical protein